VLSIGDLFHSCDIICNIMSKHVDDLSHFDMNLKIVSLGSGIHKHSQHLYLLPHYCGIGDFLTVAPVAQTDDLL
jgi:hypothetical protein